MNLHDRKEEQVLVQEESLHGYGVATEGLVAAALCWSSGGTSRQEASSPLAVSPCEPLIEESTTFPCPAPYCIPWRCCVQLGEWQLEQVQQRSAPAEVSKMEPGFAQWSMVGRQKTPDQLQEERFRLDRRKDVVGRVRQWSSCLREVVHSVLRGFQGQARQNSQQPGVTLH